MVVHLSYHLFGENFRECIVWEGSDLATLTRDFVSRGNTLSNPNTLNLAAWPSDDDNDDTTADWTSTDVAAFLDAITSIQVNHVLVETMSMFPASLLRMFLIRNSCNPNFYATLHQYDVPARRFKRNIMSSSPQDPPIFREVRTPFFGKLHICLPSSDSILWDDLTAWFTDTSLSHPNTCLQKLKMTFSTSLGSSQHDSKNKFFNVLGRLQATSVHVSILMQEGCDGDDETSLLSAILPRVLVGNKALKELHVDSNTTFWMRDFQIIQAFQHSSTLMSIVLDGGPSDQGVLQTILETNHSITSIQTRHHATYCPPLTPTTYMYMGLNKHETRKMLSPDNIRKISPHQWVDFLFSSQQLDFGFPNGMYVDTSGLYKDEHHYNNEAFKLSCIFFFLRNYTDFYLIMMPWKTVIGKDSSSLSKVTTILSQWAAHHRRERFGNICEIMKSQGGATIVATRSQRKQSNHDAQEGVSQRQLLLYLDDHSIAQFLSQHLY